MNCTSCNKTLSNNEKFCSFCGAKQINKSDTAASSSLIKWGWILMCMIPAAIAGFAIVSLIVTATNSVGGALNTIANVIVFLVGSLGVLGLPVGIILLVMGYSRRSKERA